MWNFWFLIYIYIYNLCSCIWEVAIQENIRNKVAIRSSYQDAFSTIAVWQLCWNSLKNYCDGVWFLVNLHLTFSYFELLLQKFKYFIRALINVEQLLLQITPRNVFLCSENLEKKFNLEELINPMLVCYNFTENFTVDVVVEIFQNV